MLAKVCWLCGLGDGVQGVGQGGRECSSPELVGKQSTHEKICVRSKVFNATGLNFNKNIF